MNNETFKKLVYITSGTGVSKDELNELVYLMEDYAKEYCQEQLRIGGVVKSEPENKCVHNYEKSHKYIVEECSDCNVILVREKAHLFEQ